MNATKQNRPIINSLIEFGTAASEELRELGNVMAKIPIHGDRYTAEEERRVEKQHC